MLSNLSLRFAWPAIALFLLSLSVISCKKENQGTKEASTQTEDITVLRSYLSEATGARIEKIIFDSTQQQFIIDGDGIMSLKSAVGHYAKYVANAGGRTTQRVINGGIYVSETNAKNVKVYANPATISADWITAIDQAIIQWNSTDCLIKITRLTTATGANTQFRMFDDPNQDKAFGTGAYPQDGNVGVEIGINSTISGISASKKLLLMVHEFGHTFGFTHTDEDPYWTVITETPTLDANSVMNNTEDIDRKSVV